MINVEQTIISQYANSPTIVQLIRDMDAHIAPSTDFENFYNFVWNVDTAQGFGLDIWGRIVGVGRNLTIPTSPDYFGFSEAGSDFFPFDQESFWDGTPAATQTYPLTDDAYRKLILTKALANIANTTASAINQILKNYFSDRGRAYVNDMGGMQMRYTFEFDLTPSELAIVTQAGVLPRPAGVTISLLQYASPVFGFSEAGDDSYPFNEGVFISEGASYAAI